MRKIIYFELSDIEPYPLEIIGESSYKEEIKSLFEDTDFMTGEGVDKDDFFAELVLEDSNKIIHNAVKVDIEGKTMGYLLHDDALLYRQRLKEAGYPGYIGSCYASVRGGFELDNGDIADFGVRLDLDLSKPLRIVKPKSDSIVDKPNSHIDNKGIFSKINPFKKK
jgi:hypothetical protein